MPSRHFGTGWNPSPTEICTNIVGYGIYDVPSFSGRRKTAVPYGLRHTYIVGRGLAPAVFTR